MLSQIWVRFGPFPAPSAHKLTGEARSCSHIYSLASSLPKALGKKPETSGSVLLEGFTPQAVSLNVTPAPDPGTVLSLLHVRVIAPGSGAVGMLPRHLTGNSLFNVILHFLSQPTRVSTVWIREHWAELSEDRREPAGLSAEGSCADPKPSGLHRGATRPSRWRVSRKAQMVQLR